MTLDIGSRSVRRGFDVGSERRDLGFQGHAQHGYDVFEA